MKNWARAKKIARGIASTGMCRTLILPHPWSILVYLVIVCPSTRYYGRVSSLVLSGRRSTNKAII